MKYLYFTSICTIESMNTLLEELEWSDRVELMFVRNVSVSKCGGYMHRYEVYLYVYNNNFISLCTSVHTLHYIGSCHFLSTVAFPSMQQLLY